MYDKFEPLKRVHKQPFNFFPSYYEIWMNGKMIDTGKTNELIEAKIIEVDSQEKVEVRIGDSAIHNEISALNIFDDFISQNDRLQLITIPNKTNVECMGMIGLRTIIGPTRSEKNFLRNEPYCCNVFLENGFIVKLTFSFSNPEKLIEFHSGSKTLDFIFKSSDHIRYENGVHKSGPHGGAPRAIKVEPNISDKEGYTVTIYNIDGTQSIQMAPKQMKIISENHNEIVLRGFGIDAMGSSYADYGLTIQIKNNTIEKCVLHMHDRNVNIEYLP